MMKTIFKIISIESHQVVNKICKKFIHNLKLLSFSLTALYSIKIMNTCQIKDKTGQMLQKRTPGLGVPVIINQYFFDNRMGTILSPF